MKKSPKNFMQSAAQPSMPLTKMSTQWIEDLPIDEMKLFFDNFKQYHDEFVALADLTTEILMSMGIILRSLQQNLGRSGGVVN